VTFEPVFQNLAWVPHFSRAFCARSEFLLDHFVKIKIKGPTSRKEREKWGTQCRFFSQLNEGRAPPAARNGAPRSDSRIEGTPTAVNQKPLVVTETWALVKPLAEAVM